MGYDIKLNHDVVPVSGIQIGSNACQMMDVNVDPITHIARIDYSFVSLKFEQLPQKVLSNKFMNNTVSIHQEHNKKFSAARYGNKAANQLFGDRLYAMDLSADPIATTTLSFTTFLNPELSLQEQEFKISDVFITPTTGTLQDSVSFKDANKQRFVIQNENEKDNPIAFDGSLNSKLRLLYRFYNAQTPDRINKAKMFEETSKLAGKMTHEITRDLVIENDIQLITQLDRKEFKQLRKAQVSQVSFSNDYKKKINFCGTDRAQEIIMKNEGVTRDFFKVPLLNKDNSLAVYNTAAIRLFLQTGQNEIFSVNQCDRLGAIHEFQVHESLRPDYMRPPARPARKLTAA